jgi:hypothetical protein
VVAIFDGIVRRPILRSAGRQMVREESVKSVLPARPRVWQMPCIRQPVSGFVNCRSLWTSSCSTLSSRTNSRGCSKSKGFAFARLNGTSVSEANLLRPSRQGQSLRCLGTAAASSKRAVQHLGHCAGDVAIPNSSSSVLLIEHGWQVPNQIRREAHNVRLCEKRTSI